MTKNLLKLLGLFAIAITIAFLFCYHIQKNVIDPANNLANDSTNSAVIIIDSTTVKDSAK